MVGEGEGRLPHPQPGFDQMLAHARRVPFWRVSQLRDAQRAEMNPERPIFE